MKTALLLCTVTLVLAACGQSPRMETQAPTAGPGTSALRAALPSAPPPDAPILYYPSRDRVLTSGDQSSDDLQWKPVGASFSQLLGRVLHGLVLSETEITDRDGNPRGALLPAGSRVKVLEAADWVNDGSGFRRLYRVQTEDGAAGMRVPPRRPLAGWLRAGAVALILAESNGVQAGVLLRKVVVGGGESEYSLLVVADSRGVTVFDTSYLPFPDEFHPSGVVSVSLQDVNADSRAEVVVEAETIVSLRDLGATPLRWKAWLRRGVDGALVPIFRYNTSFGSDAGFSYTATDRLVDSSGRGRRDLVRVDTDYTVVTGAEPFRTHTVSFFPWNGSQFRRAVLQDLPKIGTISGEHADLHASADAGSAAVATLSRGDRLYVYDRSDFRQSAGSDASWWYHAVSRGGAEGWILGTDMDLSWVDPMITNRAAFLAGN